MFAGLASPSHLLFGAKRIPELAKGLETGIKALREGISTSADTKAQPPESGKVRSEDRAERENETVQTVGSHAGQRGL